MRGRKAAAPLTLHTITHQFPSRLQTLAGLVTACAADIFGDEVPPRLIGYIRYEDDHEAAPEWLLCSVDQSRDHRVEVRVPALATLRRVKPNEIMVVLPQ